MKKIKVVLAALISLIFVFALTSCTDENKVPNQYTLTYLAGEGGKIAGEMLQIVDEGDDAETVTAVAKQGYEFTGWSDGVKTAERTDTNVKSDFTVTANFKANELVTYKLNYKFGTCENKPNAITFERGDFKTKSFPVPEREHFTFGGWYCGDTQVADVNGKMTVGEELLQSDETEIHAKWTANETFTYKVLLVYVTEIDAELRTINNSPVKVEYKMS